MVWYGAWLGLTQSSIWYGVAWSSMTWYGYGMVRKGRRQSAAYGESARHDGDKIEGGATSATIATASITSNKYIASANTVQIHCKYIAAASITSKNTSTVCDRVEEELGRDQLGALSIMLQLHSNQKYEEED